MRPTLMGRRGCDCSAQQVRGVGMERTGVGKQWIAAWFGAAAADATGTAGGGGGRGAI
jgi:hypothetical protein